MSITQPQDPCRVAIFYETRQDIESMETIQALLPSMRSIGFKTVCFPVPHGITRTQHVNGLLSERKKLNAIKSYIVFSPSDVMGMHKLVNATIVLLDEMKVQGIEHCAIDMLPSTERRLETHCNHRNNCNPSVHYHVRNYYMIDQIERECAKGKDGIMVLVDLKHHDIGKILRKPGYSITVDEFFVTSLPPFLAEDMVSSDMILEQALRSETIEDSEYEHLDRITVYDLYANPLLDPVTAIRTELTYLSQCSADGL